MVISNGVYLFTGEDEFRKRLSVERLKKKLLGEKADTFNCESYYGKENNAEEIIRSLETLPLTGDRKLVVLKEPELLSKEDKDRLISYFKLPRNNKAVLILLSMRFPAKDDRLIGTFSRYAKVIDFAKLEPAEVSAWIVKEFKVRDKIISRRTARLICDAADQDLGQAFSIIEQVSTFVGDRDRITDDDVTQFAEQTLAEVSAFKFLDYINEKDPSHSLRILKSLLRSGDNPSKIIGLLSWHITRLIAIKRLLIGKAPRSRMLSYFNIGSYTLNKLISQAENFTLKQLKDHLDALLDTDLMLKRSSIKGDFLLEMLTVKLSR